jgi:hypothetical protein
VGMRGNCLHSAREPISRVLIKLRIVAGLGRFRNSAIPRSAPDSALEKFMTECSPRSSPPSLRVDSARTCHATGSRPTRRRPAMIVPNPVPGLAPVPPRHTVALAADHQIIKAGLVVVDYQTMPTVMPT